MHYGALTNNKYHSGIQPIPGTCNYDWIKEKQHSIYPPCLAGSGFFKLWIWNCVLAKHFVLPVTVIFVVLNLVPILKFVLHKKCL